MPLSQSKVLEQIGEVKISEILAKSVKAKEGDLEATLSQAEKWALSVFNFLKGKHIDRMAFSAKENQQEFKRDARKAAEAVFTEKNENYTLPRLLEFCAMGYDLNTLKQVLQAHRDNQERKNKRITAYNSAVRRNAA